MHRCARTISSCVAVVILGVSFNHATASGEVLFSRDVLPILSENCFFCHGPDEEQRQGDLRLDTEEGAAPIVRHMESGSNELLLRILSDDPDSVMPPPDSNRHLTSKQKSTLSKWISEGAKWGKHWSFEPLTSPAVPEASFADVPVNNPIDAFVQRKLSEKNLRPSEEAAAQTLLRRITLDVTGLPPTPAEVENYLSDQSPDRYERAVDRLLASSAFGERMAWDWLDAARYADSNGYQGDRERTMWPWRDWVVDAFNSNMPFDQFTTLQLAGDLLPDATDEQKLATGFCRNHMINGEGGRIPEENRVDYVMDMSETMGTVWLGLTLNCCRCHDHKYDPLTQKEYYQFFAFFNQTPVTGAGGDPQTAPVLSAPTARQKQEIAELDGQLKQLRDRIAERVKALQPRRAAWEAETLRKHARQTWDVLHPQKMTARHQTLVVQKDNSILVGGKNAKNDTYTVEYPLTPGILTGLRLDALQHQSMTKGGLARSDSGNFVLTEFEVSLVKGDTVTRLKIASADATFEQGSLKVASTFDGNSKSGWAVYSGKPIDRSHSAVFRFSDGLDIENSTSLRVVLRHDSVHEYHNLGRFRLSKTSHAQPQLTDAHEELIAALRVTSADRSQDQKNVIRDEFLKQDAQHTELSKTQSALSQRRTNINKRVPKVMVMKDQPKGRPTFVLNRGLYNDVTDLEVSATTPLSLPGRATSDAHNNRLQLAEWLLSDDHPLTARVTVNRFWQTFFGLGLVRTTEDFGVQAEYPEHKKLLDWLSADFRDNGWNIKRLIRTILMSHTYRQSSAIRKSAVHGPDGAALTLAEADPENRLLARASRFRMPSWMLRDQALAVSGLLNRELGGPPVNTYQPAGVWEEATFGKKTYKQDTGENLYRRSLYIFWRRIIAPTMFFDNASRQSCTVKSLRTNTPLHALLTLNETAYVEAARTLAQNILTNSLLKNEEARIERAFLHVLARSPSPEEKGVLLNGVRRSLKQYTQKGSAAIELLTVGDSDRDESLNSARHAAWTSACLLLMNMDEALNRE